jgi:hypothetical protein
MFKLAHTVPYFLFPVEWGTGSNIQYCFWTICKPSANTDQTYLQLMFSSNVYKYVCTSTLLLPDNRIRASFHNSVYNKHILNYGQYPTQYSYTLHWLPNKYKFFRPNFSDISQPIYLVAYLKVHMQLLTPNGTPYSMEQRPS